MAAIHSNDDVGDTEEDSEEETQQEQQDGITDDQQPSLPPAQPEGDDTTPRTLPNLALAAINRLRDAATVEESPDDFRPLKRKRLHVCTETSEDTSDHNTDGDEVLRIKGPSGLRTVQQLLLLLCVCV